MSEPAATAPATPNPGTPARSRQGSTASAMPPKTPQTGPETRSRQGSVTSQAQAVSKQGSKMSLKSAGGESSPVPGGAPTSPVTPAAPVNPPSAASGTAAASAAPEGSPVVQPSESVAIARQGSQLSVHSTARQSAVEAASEPPRAPSPEGSFHSERAPTPQAMPSAVSEARDMDAELADAKAKIYNLEQQNASLQRLMSSGSGEAKIKMLTQDLNKRSERIKALEAEVKRLTKRAEDAEAKAKQSTAKERRASRSSVNVSDKASAQDKAVIRDLQAKLHEMEARLADAKTQRRESERPTSFPAGGGQDVQAALFKLQTQVAEKEAEVQILEQKLARAQAAIVSSAGAGFENEVKLQQARSALQSILRSQSPQQSRGASASPLSHQSASPTLGQYGSKPRAYYESLANPYSAASHVSPKSFSPLSQPRSVSPTRRFRSQF